MQTAERSQPPHSVRRIEAVENILQPEETFPDVLQAIRAAPILHDPFPHIYITEVFQPAFFRQLIEAIAARAVFEPAVYPGVSVDLKAENFHDHGLACANADEVPELARLHGFLKSGRFSRALLEKFADPASWGERGSAIPAEKHRFFADGRNDFTSVFDLHKDLPGYAITPHPDVEEKIITFLFYLTPNDDLRRFGTMLCRPKPEHRADIARHAEPQRHGLIARLVRSAVGRYGLDQGWLPWEWFEIAKIAEARANSFVAFAPNAESYHAVRMNIPPEHPLQERLTLRGFIRSGANSGNFIARYPRHPLRRGVFHIVRRFSRGT